jgi:SAM-dependent methyltransferase
VEREEDGAVVEGRLACPAAACRAEYPILDGVPVLVPRVREYVVREMTALLARGDLSADTESLLGDCAGPGSAFDAARQALSSYGFDHYGDLDPAAATEPSGARPGTARACLAQGLGLLPAAPSGPALDLGCGPGRAAFELAARTAGLVLGIDLSFGFLRLAQAVLREGRARYPLRRVGVVYDRRDFPVALAGAERVDFWACDALALPFARGSFGFAAALNLLDCVPAPVALLAGLARVLSPGGAAVLSTPYDWSPAATAFEGWIGGHSQRGEGGGAAETLLRSLLTPGAHPQSIRGLAIAGEREAAPWTVRVHARSAVHYRAHLLALRATGE